MDYWIRLVWIVWCMILCGFWIRGRRVVIIQVRYPLRITSIWSVSDPCLGDVIIWHLSSSVLRHLPSSVNVSFVWLVTSTYYVLYIPNVFWSSLIAKCFRPWAVFWAMLKTLASIGQFCRLYYKYLSIIFSDNYI